MQLFAKGPFVVALMVCIRYVFILTFISNKTVCRGRPSKGYMNRSTVVKDSSIDINQDALASLYSRFESGHLVIVGIIMTGNAINASTYIKMTKSMRSFSVILLARLMVGVIP